MKKSLLSLASAAVLGAGLLLSGSGSADAAGGGIHPPQQDWSFSGYFGSFDRGELQRGLQVYTEVCKACHSMKLMSYRNLEGLGYSPEQVKAYAKEFEVEDGPNEDGDMFTRPAKPSDRFAAPFPNKQAAKASNGGAYPPDFSLLVKARALGQGSIPINFLKMVQGREYASGADYVYGILTGYKEEAPEGAKIPEDKHFNTYFPGHAISMAPPLSDDLVEYADGTKATTSQMAHDVAVFLTWVSEPAMEQRKGMGIKVLLFLAFFTGVMFVVKKRVWSDVKH